MKRRTPEQYSDDTIKIINRDGRIVLKKKKKVYPNQTLPLPEDRAYDTFLHQHSSISGGSDSCKWTYRVGLKKAMDFDGLEIAHAVARVLNCKVVVLYPKKA